MSKIKLKKKANFGIKKSKLLYKKTKLQGKTPNNKSQSIMLKSQILGCKVKTVR